MRFHDFRHSAATLLLGMGVHPKIVSELLGHTQIGITLDLYSHVTATMQRDAVQAFEELLGSSQGSSRGSEDERVGGSNPSGRTQRRQPNPRPDLRGQALTTSLVVFLSLT